MRCLSPLKAQKGLDGTLTFRRQNTGIEEGFQLPCGRCIECRLGYAREWAVRCVHEARMHDSNCFITLTYSDETIGENKLDYDHFQKFMKRLRDLVGYEEDKRVGFFATGEYGEISRRMHWHAIIFNWRPTDLKPHYKNKYGDQVYTSEMLSKLWPYGHSDVGDVTIRSAGYVARYAIKKLGFEDDKRWEPISKKSMKNAIGKSWLEKYWRDVFNEGKVTLSDGSKVGIPRYYLKWLEKNEPLEYGKFVERIRQPRKEEISKARKKKELEYQLRALGRDITKKGKLVTEDQQRKKILEQKLELLRKEQKL